MSALLRWISAHKAEIVHDAALFVAASGISDALMAGKPITRDLIVGAIVTAGRRLVVELAAKATAKKA